MLNGHQLTHLRHPTPQAGKHEGPTPEEEQQARLLEWLETKLRQLKAERRATLRKEPPAARSPDRGGGGSGSPEKMAAAALKSAGGGGSSCAQQGRRPNNAGEEKAREKRWR